jgi:hypothetical protein
MKRRSFVKKSVAAAIVAATPMAFTGLVNAQGGYGTGTDSDSDSNPSTETTWNEHGDICSNTEMSDPAGMTNIESNKHDSSGKDIQCVQYLTCKNGKKCTKTWECNEWHADYPNVCKDVLTEP